MKTALLLILVLSLIAYAIHADNQQMTPAETRLHP